MNKLANYLRETHLGRFLIPFGIILVVVGILLFSARNNTMNWVQTDAVVTKAELLEEAHYNGDDYVEATYDITIKFMADGKEFETKYGEMGEKNVGDTFKIVYNPNNPAEVGMPVRLVEPIALVSVGSIVLIVGIVSLVRGITRAKEIEKI